MPYSKIAAQKLVFKKTYLEAGKITIRIESLGRHYPVTRESIIDMVSRGKHHDKIATFFTQESIKDAMSESKQIVKTKNKDKNES